MNLEDIFIAIVDQSAPKNRYERKGKAGRTAKSDVENELAKNLMSNVEKTQNAQFSSLFDDDNNS